MALVGTAAMPAERTNGSAERADDERFESRQVLARADAVNVLADLQLRRLERAAQLYRERLDGRR